MFEDIRSWLRRLRNNPRQIYTAFNKENSNHKIRIKKERLAYLIECLKKYFSEVKYFSEKQRKNGFYDYIDWMLLQVKEFNNKKFYDNRYLKDPFAYDLFNPEELTAYYKEIKDPNRPKTVYYLYKCPSCQNILVQTGYFYAHKNKHRFFYCFDCGKSCRHSTNDGKKFVDLNSPDFTRAVE